MSDTPITRFGRLFRALYGAVALLILVGDQVTKAAVARAIPEHSVIPILPHFLNVTHVRNTGAAFGLLADSPAPWKTGFLIVVSAALLVALITVAWRTPQLHWESGVGLSLILGGALSNLVDRIRVGDVVDFVDVYFRGYHWPAFNLADSAIVAGAAFLILHI